MSDDHHASDTSSENPYEEGAIATLEAPESSERNQNESAALSTTRAIDALNELATSSDFTVEQASTNTFLSEKLGINPDANLAIEQCIQSFQRHQNEVVGRYLRPSETPTPLTQNFLYVLNGWEYEAQGTDLDETKFLLPEQYRKTSGGYYLRWNNKGIVINPGKNFLKNFHAKGLHVQDINYVIVTRDCKSAYAEVTAIYDLNYQLNINGAELHIIHYYLNQTTHRELTSRLKPNFKQERNTVHCLELYVDSPDLETLDLCEGIALSYFPTPTPSCLGIQFALQGESSSQEQEITVGYVSGSPWSPSLAHNLSSCDVLIAGFENTHPDDFGKIKYNKESLGYFGTTSLVEEAAPKLLLSCEHGGREGDIRMEVVKKMRQECAFGSRQNSVILPGDTGLCVDLRTLQVCCSVSKELVDPTVVRVTKSKSAFGRLEYLSPSCFI